MSFRNRNLSVLVYANQFTMWLYRSAEDNAETICTDGYFNVINELVHDGDMFIINPSDGGMVIRVVLKDGKEITLTKPKD